jgi:5'-phosphate synthase pdxT subunit
VKKVGVLALQGDYAAHCAALERAGAAPFELRDIAGIDGADAFVLPGGESTVMGSLLLRFGLMSALIEAIRDGKPTFGTCAGLILLAATVEGKEQPGLRLLDVSVRRNAYGRQIDSFRETIHTSIPGLGQVEGVFIRAPRITARGPGVEVLAEAKGGEPVLVREGNIVGASFHPELLEDVGLHRWFLGL